MRLCILILLSIASLLLPQVRAASDMAQARDQLLAQFSETLPQLHDNAFGMPISLLSDHQDKVLQGEVLAIIEHDYAAARQTFTRPEHWCDTLLLHLNTKACTYQNSADRKLHLYSGRKFYQPIDKATKISLDFTVLADNDDFVSVQLLARTGPLGTSDYRIELAAMPLPEIGLVANPQAYSLLRFRFSYKTTWLARQLTSLYLGQLARSKVGFTVVGSDQQQRPVYIKGLQGIIERNTIRYYLAIKTHLDAVKNGDPMHQQFSSWFDATEDFHQQLHEIPRTDYLQAKQRELANQRQQQLTESLALEKARIDISDPQLKQPL